MEPNILNYPNSQEGTDAYEADLAEYNRIQKGPMIGTEFVDTVEDVVESGVEQISKAPFKVVVAAPISSPPQVPNDQPKPFACTAGPTG